MVRASKCRGVTRVEAVVVAGICAVSIALLLPAIQKARAGAGSKACQNNLMQIALGTLQYHDTYGQFAPGMDDQYVGELVQLLPYVKQNDLYKNFSFDPAFRTYWVNPYNRPPTTSTDDIPRPPDLYGCEGEVDIFLCPDGPQPGETVTALLVVLYGTRGVDFRSDESTTGHLFTSSPGRLVMARSHYLGMAGDFRDPNLRGVFTYNSQTRLDDLVRGPDNTIIYAEYWGGFVAWNGQGGIPSGWSNGSRSVGFNYSAVGTCPSTAGACDFQQSMGLGFGAFGALHMTQKGSFSFNVAMADGSVRSLPGDIDYALWETLCSVVGPGGSPVRSAPDEAWAGIDR
jgi:hypothetical protein